MKNMIPLKLIDNIKWLHQIGLWQIWIDIFNYFWALVTKKKYSSDDQKL